MSGHNKWSTIKHKKGKCKRQREKYLQNLHYIIVAVKEGGADPEYNPSLKIAIQKLRQKICQMEYRKSIEKKAPEMEIPVIMKL